MEDRRYQDDLLDQVRVLLRTNRSVCAVSPTGSGKTVMFLRIVQGAVAKGKTVWIIVHSEELVEQTCEKLREAGIAHGVIQGKLPILNCQVQVCMIQSLKNRLHDLQPPNIIIVDECHHTPAAMYDKVLTWAPRTTKVIGFTATPQRLDGKGLRAHYEQMVLGPTVPWLIERQFLVPTVAYGPPGVDTSGLKTRFGDYIQKDAALLMSDQKIVGDIIDKYKKYANGLQTIVFAASVAEAYRLAEEANKAGIPAIAVDGSVPKEERKRRIRDFKNRRYQWIVNYQLFTEGVDCPGIECVIIARITKSLALHLQMIGRGLRTDKVRGKTECILIDCAGNSRVLGLPEDHFPWSLDGAIAQKDEEDDESISLTTCPDCYCMYRGKKCPKCDYELAEGRKIEYVKGELVEITVAKRHVDGVEYERLKQAKTKPELIALCRELEIEFSAAARILKSRARSLSDLRHVEVVLDFARGWAKTLYRSRHGQEGLDKALKLEREARAKDYEEATA